MLWIDITDTFATWSGSPNGIQRTLLGLASAARGRPDCGLCVWDRRKGEWKQVPSDLFFNLFNSQPSSVSVTATQIPRIVAGSALLLLRLVLRALLRTTYLLGGDVNLENSRPWFVESSKTAVDRLKKSFRSLCLESRGTSQSNFVSSPTIRFRHGRDHVLFADSHWNCPGIVRSLKEQPGQPTALGFIHDVIPLERPDFVSNRAASDFRIWLEELQQCCDHILCNSHYSAGRLIAHFAPDAPRPSVRSIKFGNSVTSIPAVGADKLKFGDLCLRYSAKTSAIHPSVASADSWYLWVGSLDIRKNIDVLLLAAEGLARREALGKPIVIVGRISTGSEYYLHKIRKNPSIRNRIIHIEAAPDSLLQALQNGADLFLFTSWEEGYGLPVAEALQAGIPVIASNATSIPEVAGDLVDYFEPWNSGQLAGLIERFETDPAYRADLKARAARFVPTDWNETIDDIISGLPQKAG